MDEWTSEWDKWHERWLIVKSTLLVPELGIREIHYFDLTYWGA
jgi:hypothetical protein